MDEVIMGDLTFSIDTTIGGCGNTIHKCKSNYRMVLW
jgi:hypothetical protein